MQKPLVNIFWFRRDLRLEDNAGLYHALKAGHPIVPIFIFDQQILEELEDRDDRRVAFIYMSLLDLKEKLEKSGATIDAAMESPTMFSRALMADYQIEQVFANHDYEPYARERDEKIKQLLRKRDRHFRVLKTR